MLSRQCHLNISQYIQIIKNIHHAIDNVNTTEHKLKPITCTNCNTLYPKFYRICRIKYLFLFENVHTQYINNQLQILKQFDKFRNI